MFQYRLITDSYELIQHKDEIRSLFLKCFNKDLDVEMWEWIYLKNICGSPIVSLCYNDKGMLIGHYAVVPAFSKKRNKTDKLMLSMTTMVDKDYRRHGLFVKQAGLVYEYAKLIGYSYIYGFPNKNSAPGFRKRLGWNIASTDYVAFVTKAQLVNCKQFNNHLDAANNSIIDLLDDSYIDWRLSKPNTIYTKRNNVIFKKYNDIDDIVYISKGYEHELDDNAKYHILLDGSISELIQYKVFEYQFGYLPLNETEKLTQVDFKKDLLLSDVF